MVRRLFAKEFGSNPLQVQVLYLPLNITGISNRTLTTLPIAGKTSRQKSIFFSNNNPNPFPKRFLLR